MINIFSREKIRFRFFSHRSIYERDDKPTPCLSLIKFLHNYLRIYRIVPKNIYNSLEIKLFFFYFILEIAAIGIKTISQVLSQYPDSNNYFSIPE